jgi:dedicated sortase system histidine kinase
MSLRRQLLLVSLLLLSLPWAGCQFIREMEGALRQGQEQSLQATATAIAAVLGQQPQLIYPHSARLDAPPDSGNPIYAQPLEQPLILDGYGDGWEEITGVNMQSEPGAAALALQYKAVTRNGYLYLLLRVEDQQVVYHNPGLSQEPNGDRLVLRTWREGRRQDYVIATAAPGRVHARPGSRRQRGTDARRIRGYWQDAVGGYTLELEIPLSYTGGRLGFYLANVGKRAGGTLETLGNTGPLDTEAPPWLIYSPEGLQQALTPFRHQGSQVQVLDRSHWLVADLPSRQRSGRPAEDTFWLLRVIYRSILSRAPLDAPPVAPTHGKAQGTELDSALAGLPAIHRYRDPEYLTRTTLSTAVPIKNDQGVIGAVILRQSGEEYLSLTDQAFSKLLGYSVLAVGMGAFGLLAYASLLSWRIGRLSRAAGNAISEDGLQLQGFPRSNAPDEIGELSRNYANLLERLREYNDYLRTLSRKLSHELRTPVAVIQTSLENLEDAAHDSTEQAVYLSRAREGLQRLNRILTAMSEANRLEESIRNNRPAPLDLVPLLREVFHAYQAVYRQHDMRLAIEVEEARVSGVADLLVQALDKLVDNAASFCPAGGEIRLGLDASDLGWDIYVDNAGPTLPPGVQSRLFEPMVSLREQGDNEVHLGLGLHVVRLISEFHRGHVSAQNLPEQSGVRFTLSLPAIQPEHTQDSRG